MCRDPPVTPRAPRRAYPERVDAGQPHDDELVALRRRAWGRDADILSDPDALARLAELEARAAPGEPAAGMAGERGAAGAAGAADPDAAAETAPPVRKRATRWQVLLVAAVGVVGLVLGAGAAARMLTITPTVPDGWDARVAATGPPEAVAAFRFAYGGHGQVLARVPVVPASPAPTDATLRWFVPIGSYFGAQVAASPPVGDDRVCLLVGAAHTHLRCVSKRLFDSGALMVTVPYGDLPDGQRPAGMRLANSIGYWWTPDGSLTLVMGVGDIGP